MIGIAGSEEKCSILTDQLGFDVAINYNKQNVKVSIQTNMLLLIFPFPIQSAVRRAAPKGVNCYFDNVGGAISQVGDPNPNGDIDDDAYSNKSYSHQVGICHNDEGCEYDTVNFAPYLYIIIRAGQWPCANFS